MKKQYIGITGFMNISEVEKVLDCLPSNIEQKIMIGLLVSGKTINGIPNKWPNRYPKKEDIPNVFTNHSDALNLVHYNTDEKEPEKIADEMSLIFETAGPHCHGFQLNLVWPKPSMISRWRNNGLIETGSTIVLQIGGTAMAKCNHNPIEISKRISNYNGIVDYVLLDGSGGMGTVLSGDFMIDCLSEFYKNQTFSYPSIKFGIAGGLSPDTLHLVKPILSKFPDVSIDAEGRLRTIEDRLDIGQAQNYLYSAIELMNF